MKTKQGYFDPKIPRALDDRHYKATQAEILTIPQGARYLGMEIYAYTEDTWYQFQGGVTDLDLVESRPAAAVQEAPEDGSRYGRKDAGWEADPIQSDAPVDGSKYARQDGAWEIVSEGGLGYGVWYVDENYAGGGDDGSPQKPFSSSTGVNNAIAAASDGDVIVLAPGSYLFFGATTKNLTFIGYGSDTDANNGTELLVFGDTANTASNAVRHRFIRLTVASLDFTGGNAYNVEFFDVKQTGTAISVTCTDFQANACYLDMNINAATVDIRNTRFLYNSIIGGTGEYRLTNVHLGYGSTGNPAILEDITTTGNLYLESCTLGANITCNFLYNKDSQWTGAFTGTLFPNEDFGPQPKFYSAGVPTILGGVVNLEYGGRLVTVGAETGNTDDLDSITGALAGDVILLFASSGDTITVKHNNGGVNPDIRLAKGADFELVGGAPPLILWFSGVDFYEIGNSQAGSASASPLTTKGDLYTYDTDNQRLPVGSDGQVLSANSAQATGLEWVNPGAASVPVDTTIWYVTGRGNNSNAGHLIGDALLTLQEAVNQAAANDVIYVDADLGVGDTATIPTTKHLTFIGIPTQNVANLPSVSITANINTNIRIQGCRGNFGGTATVLTGTELILENCYDFDLDNGAATVQILNSYDVTLGDIQVGNLIINGSRMLGFNPVNLTGVSCHIQGATFETNEGDWILNGAITVNFHNTVINLSSISGDGVGGNATVVLWNSSFSRGDMADTTNLNVIYRNQAPSFGSNLHYMENINVPTGTGNVVNTEAVQNINLQVTGGTTAEIIEFTGGAEGSELIVRPNTGHTITLKHNDAGATNKIILSDAADRVLSDVNDVVRLFVLPDGTFKELGVAGSGSASPLTTKGDIYVYDTADQRLAVGTDDQVLTADSGDSLGVSWQTVKPPKHLSDYASKAAMIADQANQVIGYFYYETENDAYWELTAKTASDADYRGGGVVEETIVLSLGDYTNDIAVNPGLAYWIAPWDCTLVSVIGALLVTAPTGGSAIFDMNLNGTTVMATNKMEIEATENSTLTATTQPTLTTTAVSQGDIISCDIDQIGSTLAGVGPSVTIIVTRS